MIKDFLEKFSQDENLDFIVETAHGLNVARDEVVSDRNTPGDNNCLFYNVIESGSINTFSSRKIDIITNYEVGLLKRCIKETDGIEYYNDIKELKKIIIRLYKRINEEFNVKSATFDTSVDSLDNNNVIIKLNFAIIDTINIC